jgi:hypothetical protein
MIVDDEAIGFVVCQTIRRSIHVATERRDAAARAAGMPAIAMIGTTGTSAHSPL